MKRSTCAVIACALAVTMAQPAAQRVTLSTDLIKDWRAHLSTFGLKATSKADILQALKQSYEFGDAVLHEFPDDALVQTIKGPPWIGEATRAKIVYYTMGHTLDIYGQMVVYLRLNGIVPPASRRGGV